MTSRAGRYRPETGRSALAARAGRYRPETSRSNPAPLCQAGVARAIFHSPSHPSIILPPPASPPLLVSQWPLFVQQTPIGRHPESPFGRSSLYRKGFSWGNTVEKNQNVPLRSDQCLPIGVCCNNRARSRTRPCNRQPKGGAPDHSLPPLPLAPPHLRSSSARTYIPPPLPFRMPPQTKRARRCGPLAGTKTVEARCGN